MIHRRDLTIPANPSPGPSDSLRRIFIEDPHANAVGERANPAAALSRCPSVKMVTIDLTNHVANGNQSLDIAGLLSMFVNVEALKIVFPYPSLIAPSVSIDKFINDLSKVIGRLTKLTTFSLTCPLNQRTMAVLMTSLSTAPLLTNLHVRDTSRTTDARIDTGLMPNLQFPNVTLFSAETRSLRASSMVELLGRCTFPHLETLLLSGMDPLPGMGSFMSNHRAKLSEVMLDFRERPLRPYPHLDLGSSLTTMITPYDVRFVDNIEFPCLHHIAFTGVFSDDDMDDERRIQMSLLQRTMASILDRSRFPALRTIEFLEVARYDIDGAIWHIEDAAMWREWARLSERYGISLVDSHGERITGAYLVTYSTPAPGAVGHDLEFEPGNPLVNHVASPFDDIEEYGVDLDYVVEAPADDNNDDSATG